MKKTIIDINDTAKIIDKAINPVKNVKKENAIPNTIMFNPLTTCKYIIHHILIPSNAAADAPEPIKKSYNKICPPCRTY